MKIEKWSGRLLQTFLLFAVLFFASGRGAVAAFPHDMADKPVSCRPHDGAPAMLDFYSDAALTKEKGQVERGELLLEATKVEKDAIYGSFRAGGKDKNGWFPLAYFLSDPGYKNRYLTVRSPMTVYTDSSRDEKQASIKKYSGVIVVGKEGGSRQVIYQKKGGYGIGWMSADTLENTLEYDGREKQTTADGTYFFRCQSQGDTNAVKALPKQPGLMGAEVHTWTLKHTAGDNYYIKDEETGKYLAVGTRDGGLSYYLCQTRKPDAENSLFHLDRANAYYTIRSTKSGQYVGRDINKNLYLEKYRLGSPVCWRISAPGKMLDEKQPMVFTQYDPAWCGTPYGSEGCMGTAGCGILATVNAVYALNGHYMDVKELADYAVEKNYRIEGSGTDEGIFKAACKAFGRKYNFTWDGQGGKLDRLKKKLAAGDTAVVHVLGHYVSVVAYDEERNRFLMLDSNCLPKREDTPFGDWISPSRLVEGTLEAQNYYYFKRRDPLQKKE